MARSDRTNLLQFFGRLIARLRKWLIKIGSPFRISRRFVRDVQSVSRRRRRSPAGFVLPTVAMVSVLTTFLVVTIVSRSAERAQTAANARVEQTFRTVNTAVVDRARAKLAALLADDRLPRTTPSDAVLDSILMDAKYTYPDEIRLQITNDGLDSNNGQIRAATNVLSQREYISSAWKFPIDTDGNGRFDAFGLYSIVFRTRPTTETTTRPVSTLEARALPMDEGLLTAGCANAGANVATTEGWTESSGKLKKAFFIYATTVPIVPINSTTTLNDILNTARPAGDPSSPAGQRAANIANYEFYTGNATFSAIELQQDRERNPLNNNAVWFENDLEIARPATFRLNGRIYTSGNLMVGALNESNPISFYQVSASNNDANPTNGIEPGSCYYKEENSKIIVAGNVVLGDALSSSNLIPPKVHLFVNQNANPLMAAGGNVDIVQSVADNGNNRGRDVAGNEAEYNRRISVLVQAAIARGPQDVSPPGFGKKYTEENITSPDPKSVKRAVAEKINDEGLSTPEEFNEARRKVLEIYFRERVRKVPFREVNMTVTPPADPSPLLREIRVGDGIELAPPIEWMIPYDANNPNSLPFVVRDVNDYASALDGKGLLKPPQGVNTIQIAVNGNLLSPPATEPSKQKDSKEKLVGDRVLVGNNLPARWLKRKGSITFFANNRVENEDNRGLIAVSDSNSVLWNVNENTPDPIPRYRLTQADTLAALGENTRGGFWEISAALDPSLPEILPDTIPEDSPLPTNIAPKDTPTVGGLRVVTNAGIFTRLNNPSVITADAPGTFLPRYKMPVVDNPATPHNEADFSEFVVWPDSMPMTNAVQWLDPTNYNSVCVPASKCTGTIANGEAGYYPIDPKTGNILVGATTAEKEANRRLASRKGDLQMRATAVYHYKYDAFNPDRRVRQDYQRPVACVSSYYDPSFSLLENPFSAPSATNRLISTARNRSGLPWESASWGRSNNGIVYTPRTTASNLGIIGSYISYAETGPNAFKFTGYDPKAENPADASVPLVDRLAYQANLIYPNGRWVNEPLRNVLRKVINSPAKDFAKANLTIAEQATIDANLCALEIIQNTNPLTPVNDPVGSPVNGAQIPHGTFKEAAFLDGREVKSLNKNEDIFSTSGRESFLQGVPFRGRPDIYDLEIEQRQPLESGLLI
jgi:hypothetical protein